MRTILILISLVNLYAIRLDAQVSAYGLPGHQVTCLAVFSDTVYAGTNDSGVCRRAIGDTAWISMGLMNKQVRSVSPDSLPGTGTIVLAGLSTIGEPADSAPMFRYAQGGWTRDDAGIDTNIVAVHSVRTMITGGGAHRTFLTGDFGPIYWRTEGLWQSSSGILNGLLVRERHPDEVWVSGQSWLGDPLLIKSTDPGDGWIDVLDTMAYHTGYLYSLAFPDTASWVFFAGGYGVVWKSDGVSWDSVLNEPCFFPGMAVHPFDPDVMFAGGNCDGLGRLFRSGDGGTNWDEIVLPESLAGITSLETAVRDSLGLFIATEGDGVYRYAEPSETAALRVRAGWNLVSVPRTVGDYSVQALFPSAVSDAFSYGAGYRTEDTLAGGSGYWVKFDAPRIIPFAGAEFIADTIDVQPGWNIVGSLSHPLPAGAVQSIPVGIVSSPFYGYDGEYAVAGVLEPGRGYWVKVSGEGKLILTE